MGDQLAELLQHGGVALDIDGSVAHVVLNRPERRNAMTPATWRALAAVGDSLPDEVRAVVVRGEGASFSAGLDRAMFSAEGVPGERSLAELASMPPDDLDAVIDEFQAAFTWLRAPERLTVAAVAGHAVGAGFQLALSCDLMLVADDARLAMRETQLGLVPDLTGTSPLVHAVGVPRATEICLTGRWVEAEEAVRIGLAVAVVPAAELLQRTGGLVDAVLTAPADAVRETIALLQGAGARTLDEQRALERAAQGRRLRAMVG